MTNMNESQMVNKQYNDNNEFNPDQETLVKFLLSKSMAGLIIGKGGQNIAHIKSKAKVYMMVSKNSDIFPGTNDRVGVLIGTGRCISTALNMIHECIAESSQEPDTSSTQLVIMSDTAGKIIGKKGINIREMIDTYGCEISVSKKIESCEFNERIITFEGKWEKVMKAIDVVIARNSANPPSKEVNYAEYLDRMNQSSSASYSRQSSSREERGGAGGGSGFGSNYGNREYNAFVDEGRSNYYRDESSMNSSRGHGDPYPMMRNILRRRNKNPRDIEIILAAVSVVDSHEATELLALLGDNNNDERQQSRSPQHSPQHQHYGGGVSRSSPRESPQQRERHQGDMHGNNYEMINKLLTDRSSKPNMFHGYDMGDAHKEYTFGKTILVSEEYIGLIIGHKGCNLNDIMSLTNTLVTVSKRGVYAENTTDRIISIECQSKQSPGDERESFECQKKAFDLINDFKDVIISKRSSRNTSDMLH